MTTLLPTARRTPTRPLPRLTGAVLLAGTVGLGAAAGASALPTADSTASGGLSGAAGGMVGISGLTSVRAGVSGTLGVSGGASSSQPSASGLGHATAGLSVSGNGGSISGTVGGTAGGSTTGGSVGGSVGASVGGTAGRSSGGSTGSSSGGSVSGSGSGKSTSGGTGSSTALPMQLVGLCVHLTTAAPPVQAGVVLLDRDLVATLTRSGVPLQQLVVPCPTSSAPGQGSTGTGAGGTGTGGRTGSGATLKTGANSSVPVSAALASDPSGLLPHTGGDTVPWLLYGAVLVGGGAALTVGARRRLVGALVGRR